MFFDLLLCKHPGIMYWYLAYKKFMYRYAAFMQYMQAYATPVRLGTFITGRWYL